MVFSGRGDEPHAATVSIPGARHSLKGSERHTYFSMPYDARGADVEIKGVLRLPDVLAVVQIALEGEISRESNPYTSLYLRISPYISPISRQARSRASRSTARWRAARRPREI